MKSTKQIKNEIREVPYTPTKKILIKLEEKGASEDVLRLVKEELKARDNIIYIVYNCLKEIISGRTWKELPKERRSYIREQEESIWRFVLK
jgi:hypothetical protein